MSLRDKLQADYDLERVMTMLDEALTSRDERVQDALRNLLVIVTLTKTQEDNRMAIETSHGPLRQMREDINNLNRSLHKLREDVYDIKNKVSYTQGYGQTAVSYGGYSTPTISQSPYTQTK